MSAPKPGEYGEPWVHKRDVRLSGIHSRKACVADTLLSFDAERIVSCVNAMDGHDPEALKPLLALVRECLSDYSHPNFTDRRGMADRLRDALSAFGGGAR